MGLISINTKEAIFEWLISDPRVDKKKGAREGAPFFSSRPGAISWLEKEGQWFSERVVLLQS